ncbi:hypothetical protein HYW83_06285 [Candidatus Peregrinibacteria bacterium]|nr:hypothetical protein [Candidatus Peregrinibacteria bacterium]
MQIRYFVAIYNRILWLGVVVLVTAFFLPEPWNEFGLYVAWFIFGVALLLKGFIGIRTAEFDYVVVEMFPAVAEGEIKGKKAQSVSVLMIVLAILIFILPGFFLALEILLQEFRS